MVAALALNALRTSARFWLAALLLVSFEVDRAGAGEVRALEIQPVLKVVGGVERVVRIAVVGQQQLARHHDVARDIVE
jgi:hypothetical protein